MSRNAIVFFIVAVAMTAVVWLTYVQAYPFVLASEEARKSVEVTEAQRAELYAARYSSDLIGFGILGAAVGLVSGATCFRRGVRTRWFLGAAAGAVLGFGAGALGSWIGHYIEFNHNLQLDPMVFWVARTVQILGPMALVAALAAAVSGEPGRDMAPALIGSILGTMAAAILYAVLTGTLTTNEVRDSIMPAYNNNRLLLSIVAIVVLNGCILFQLGRTPKPVAADQDKPEA